MKDFKVTFFYTKTTSTSRGKLLDWSNPKVMGILNVTPDSFFDGGVNNSVEKALLKVKQMLVEGVDIIDIGGYSSRSDAIDISEEEEKSRVLPIIIEIRKRYPDVILSIDTFRGSVAEAALESGVNIVNDITGGVYDATIFEKVAKHKGIYCMMHMKGTPQTMKNETEYADIFCEMIDFFLAQIKKAYQAGIKDIIVDPGFGFAKTEEQNYLILKYLEVFKLLGLPILIGISRKSMIYKPLNKTASLALNGSTVLHTIALTHGAHIYRVHDVEEMKEAINLIRKL